VKDFFDRLIEGCRFTGKIKKDACNLLRSRGCHDVLEHSAKVARGAEELATSFGVERKKASIAGYLHDVGRVFPETDYLHVAEEIGLALLREERKKPILLHQKLSMRIARDIFNISDEELLQAIGCHTTLKEKPGKLDMVLFTADKLSWDSRDSFQVRYKMKKGLEKGLEWAVLPYLEHQVKFERDSLHPMTLQAYQSIRKMLRGNGI
jgi:predicted HD superfamily hydrolase involved in NAD metabolism